MAALTSKVQDALQESRILVLGTQALFGFTFRSTFEKSFSELPRVTQHLRLVELGLLLLVFALLLTATCYHRLVERGEDTPRLLRTVTRLMDFTLLPFAAAIALELFTVAEKVLGRTGGLAFALGGGATALFFFYGLEFLQRRRDAANPSRSKTMGSEQPSEQPQEGTPLKNKIRHILTETRVILPGAQALLGFQIAVVFTEAFEALPASSKYVYLASLALIALSVILLMTPAAYHRLVERGEETERFHRFTSRALIASIIPLALAFAGDIYLVVRKVTESLPIAIGSAGAVLVLCFGLWFGYTLLQRHRTEDPRPRKLRGSAPRRPAHA